MPGIVLRYRFFVQAYYYYYYYIIYNSLSVHRAADLNAQ